MAKKAKKVYKPHLTLAPKASLNRKWTVWRASEMKNRQANAVNEMKRLALLALLKDRQLVLEAAPDTDTRLRYETINGQRVLTQAYGVEERETKKENKRRGSGDQLALLSSADRHRADLRMRLHHRIWEMDKRAAVPKMKNYCHYIGRARSVNRKLFMSRHMFRKFARFGMLPGFVKERC